MKSFFSLVAAVIFGITVAQGGWVTPPAAAPENNAAQIIHTGSAYQQKVGLTGKIRANDYWIESIGKWVSQSNNSPVCNWSGWKCDCIREETGGSNDGRIMLGFKCQNNTLRNFRVFDINVTANPSDANCLSPASYPYCSIYSIAGVLFTVPAPYNLSGTMHPHPSIPGSMQATLTWSWNPPGGSGYKFYIERWTAVTGWTLWGLSINATNANNYTATVNIQLNTLQLFRVKAKNGAIFSQASTPTSCPSTPFSTNPMLPCNP